MIDQDKPRTGAPRRDHACLQTTRDIVIPAGTILRQAPDQRGGRGYVAAAVGFGKDFAGDLVVQDHADAVASGFFNRVVA